MKANELMIGDIVRVTKDLCIPKGTIVSIKGIDADNRFIKKHLVGSATCLPINNEDGMTGGIWVEYLEPIPLTPDILEKNGWKVYKEKGIDWLILDLEVGASSIRISENETPCSLWWLAISDILSEDEDGVKDGNYVGLNFNYVHELQHALRLCGIEKEIEL